MKQYMPVVATFILGCGASVEVEGGGDSGTATGTSTSTGTSTANGTDTGTETSTDTGTTTVTSTDTGISTITGVSTSTSTARLCGNLSFFEFCETCADDICCEEKGLCSHATECGEVVLCILGCDYTNQACFDGCKAANPTGAQHYAELLACIGQCSECAGVLPP